MTTSELATALSSRSGIPTTDVATVLEALADEVRESLARGEKVQVNGLFVADTAERAERGGRNPRTGEPITIPAHRAVRITPSSTLKRAVAAH